MGIHHGTGKMFFNVDSTEHTASTYAHALVTLAEKKMTQKRSVAIMKFLQIVLPQPAQAGVDTSGGHRPGTCEVGSQRTAELQRDGTTARAAPKRLQRPSGPTCR